MFDFGGKAGATKVAKLAGNFLIIAAIEAMAEALTLVGKNGPDPMEVVRYEAIG